MFEEKPVAYAKIKGSGSHPETTGQLFLFPAQGGTIVWVEIQDVYDADQKLAQGFRG